MQEHLFPRYGEQRLREALHDSPAVLLHGPRQSGKTTLSRAVASQLGMGYRTLDEDATRLAAIQDPLGFVADLPRHCVLDEVQRAPDLFTSLKLVIDRDRTPGRFLLAGSSNVLLLPRLADSLAGRMSIIRLHPLAQVEIERSQPTFLDQLFKAEFSIREWRRQGSELATRMVAGGYPSAIARSDSARQAAWYDDFVASIVERDVRTAAQLRTPSVALDLLRAAASQTSRTFNLAALASPFELSRVTIGDYVALLERVFLVERIRPWFTNALLRLTKAPKLHVLDSGIASALLGVDAASLYADRPLFGQILESFVVQELRRQASWHQRRHDFFHLRDRDGMEVDLVIERGIRAVAGVEVKASSTIVPSDFRGLRKLQAAAGDRFAGGVVLYDGETAVPFGPRLYAVPIRALWSPPTG
jgi:hypothetical protein